MRVPFIGGAYFGRSTVARQQADNLYFELYERPPQKDNEVGYLVPTPGLKALPGPGAGPVRLAYVTSRGDAFFVRGKKVYMLSSLNAETATPVELAGELLTLTNRVRMADNGIDGCLVDGANLYWIDLNFPTTVTRADDTNFMGSDFVEFVDGYFVFNRPNTAQFYLSNSYSRVIDPADFGTAEGSPDRLVAFVACNRDLWLFGANSGEVFYNSGDEFPFTRVQGGFFQSGCVAPNSLCQSGGSVFLLARDKDGLPYVAMSDGYRLMRISDNAIEAELNSYSVLRDCTAYVHQVEGHIFYVMSFNAADRTLAYDVITKSWHTRSQYDLVNDLRKRALPEVHMIFRNKSIVGAYDGSGLYELTRRTPTENGRFVRRRRVAAIISNDNLPIRYDAVELDITAGAVGQDRVNTALLRFSDDGGKTWSNYKYATFGFAGQYAHRPIWRRLGQARERMFEVTIAEPVDFAILGLHIHGAMGLS